MSKEPPKPLRLIQSSSDCTGLCLLYSRRAVSFEVAGKRDSLLNSLKGRGNHFLRQAEARRPDLGETNYAILVGQERYDSSLGRDRRFRDAFRTPVFIVYYVPQTPLAPSSPLCTDKGLEADVKAGILGIDEHGDIEIN